MSPSSPRFFDQQVLQSRITDNSSAKPLVFLLGSAFSSVADDPQHAIPGVDGIVSLVEKKLEKYADALSEIAQARQAPVAAYQAAFASLIAYAGIDTASQLIRQAVVRAVMQKTRLVEEAGAISNHTTACVQLMSKPEFWFLSKHVAAMGRILCSRQLSTSNLILTTNFDPLLEIAIAKAGGIAQRVVLSTDGSLENFHSDGCTVIYLHGFWFGTEQLHTPQQLQHGRPRLLASLRRLLSRSTLVVLGYSGWDDVLSKALGELIADPGAEPDVLWGFFESAGDRILKGSASLFERLADGAARGRVTYYSGVDIRQLLPALEAAIAGRPGPVARTTSKRASRVAPKATTEKTGPRIPAATSGIHRSGATANRTLFPLSFGDPTAEVDRDALFSKGWFLETPLFAELQAGTKPAYVVGRRGAGKSALFFALRNRFERDDGILCVTLTPRDFSVASAKELVALLLTRAGTNWAFLHRSLWAAALRIEWALLLSRHQRFSRSDLRTRTAIVNFLREMEEPANLPLDQRLSYFIRRLLSGIAQADESRAIQLVNESLGAMRNEGFLREFDSALKQLELRVVNLVDALDEHWDGGVASAHLIGGLLSQCASDYSECRIVSNVFIRDNMYRVVKANADRWDRIEAYFRRIHWSEEQLLELLRTRLQSGQEKRFTINDVFAPSVDGTATIRYLIRKTQFKPRELIHFCTYSLNEAKRHYSPRIREQDILAAEVEYSRNRLHDLVNEYRDSLPGLDMIFERFRNGPGIRPYSALVKAIDEFVEGGDYFELCPRLSLSYSNALEIIQLLLGIGFCGVALSGEPTPLFKYYGEDGDLYQTHDAIESIVVHPAFEKALALTEPRAFDTREASDAQLFPSPKIRQRPRLTSEEPLRLSAELNTIPVGDSGSTRYEQTLRDAIGYAFDGYLVAGRVFDDPHRHMRWKNRGRGQFFAALKKRGAEDVTVSYFNVAELSTADFMKAAANCRAAKATLCLICHRGDRLDPVKSEISGLAAAFAPSAQVTVLLLSDAKLRQLFEKRKRGRTDDFIEKLRSQYARYFEDKRS